MQKKEDALWQTHPREHRGEVSLCWTIQKLGAGNEVSTWEPWILKQARDTSSIWAFRERVVQASFHSPAETGVSSTLSLNDGLLWLNLIQLCKSSPAADDTSATCLQIWRSSAIEAGGPVETTAFSMQFCFMN